MRISSKWELDEEEQAVAWAVELDKIVADMEMPKWFYLASEWSYMVGRKVRLQKELSKIEGNLGYNSTVAE